MTFEIDIIRWLQNHRTDLLDQLFKIFTMFGEELIIIIILGGIYWTIDKHKGKRLAVLLFISLGMNSLLKVIIRRPRPFQVDQRIINLRPQTSQSYSMPSGHTQSAATLYFGIAYLFKKRLLWLIAITLIVLVGMSRMYIGVHYLSDVMIGALLGFIFILITNKLYKHYHQSKQIYRALLVLSVLLFVLMILINHLKGYRGEILYFELESLSKMLGALCGFSIGTLYEERYVQFQNHSTFYKNAMRLILGLIIVMGLRLGLKSIFSLIVNPNNIELNVFKSLFAVCLDFIRYAVIVFVGLGLYPKLFKFISI